MGIFGKGADAGNTLAHCVGCGRRLADLRPDPHDDSSFAHITAASFYAPHAPARGRLGICRSCSLAIVAAFAHAVPQEKEEDA